MIATDAALPAGAAVAAEVLVRLGRATGEARYGERARELVRALGGALERAPLGCCQLLSAALLLEEDPRDCGDLVERSAPLRPWRVAAVGAGCPPGGAGRAAEGEVLLREEFTSLDAWRPLTFPKIERHSTYSIATNADQSEFWLKAESDNSASGVVWKKQYDVYAYPRLRWRWRVENVYGRATRRRSPGTITRSGSTSFSSTTPRRPRRANA